MSTTVSDGNFAILHRPQMEKILVTFCFEVSKYSFTKNVYCIIYHHTYPSYSVFNSTLSKGDFYFFFLLEIGEISDCNQNFTGEIIYRCVNFALDYTYKSNYQQNFCCWLKLYDV